MGHYAVLRTPDTIVVTISNLFSFKVGLVLLLLLNLSFQPGPMMGGAGPQAL